MGENLPERNRTNFLVAPSSGNVLDDKAYLELAAGFREAAQKRGDQVVGDSPWPEITNIPFQFNSLTSNNSSKSKKDKSGEKAEPKENTDNAAARARVTLMKGWFALFYDRFSENIKDHLQKSHLGWTVDVQTERSNRQRFEGAINIDTSLWKVQARAIKRYLTLDGVEPETTDGDQKLLPLKNSHWRAPANHGGAIFHEIVHLISNLCRNQEPPNEKPLLAGVEEGFCDYFALLLVELLGIHGAFVETLGSALAFYWRESDDHLQAFGNSVANFRQGDEVQGDDRNMYARRDYSLFLKSDTEWKKDRHFFGKQVCWFLRKARAGFVLDNSEKEFDDYVWKHFFSREVFFKPKQELLAFLEGLGDERQKNIRNQGHWLVRMELARLVELMVSAVEIPGESTIILGGLKRTWQRNCEVKLGLRD